MAKYYGNIGYGFTKETEPGVWREEITERPYYGDFIRNSRRLQNGTAVNGEVSISNRISILSDPFAAENFFAIRYAVYNGVKWTVTEAEVSYPRIILTLRGVYNDGQEI
ncbi:MAG: hypothetical protein NC078_03930 [Ruminococcus sp.]|nr:hypothetical protein [Ruminococcus sp.]